jgi:hypothetical protein
MELETKDEVEEFSKWVMGLGIKQVSGLFVPIQITV